MRLADVITRDVEVVSPDASVREAARKMDELNVGVLPVCDGRRVVGVITDRDIVVRSTAAGLAPDRTRVGDVMTEEVSWCYEDDTVEAAAQKMTERQVRRLPVVDRAKMLVGIVSLGDLATGKLPEAGEALQKISEPSEPDRSGTLSSRRAEPDRHSPRSG